jgi:hypothetical protein
MSEGGACDCFEAPLRVLSGARELGMDDRFAEVSVLVCPRCGQPWLRYFYELEAFSRSGRWYLGAVTSDTAARITPAEARSLLEGMGWYFYGGSYYDGRVGRRSGPIS